MTKPAAVSALAALVLLSPGRAFADAIDKGTFALGAERLTGMFHSDEKIGNAASQGMTSLALLGNTGYAGSVAEAWQFPRVGLDGFVTDGLSLGGSLVVLHRSLEGGTDATDLLVAPRIGFAYMFSRVVGIWPRASLAYWHQWRGSDQGGDANGHSFAFGIDVPLLIAPVKNFAITVGPLVDFGFGGKQTTNNGIMDVTTDTSFTQFGLSAGVVGFL